MEFLKIHLSVHNIKKRSPINLGGGKLQILSLINHYMKPYIRPLQDYQELYQPAYQTQRAMMRIPY